MKPPSRAQLLHRIEQLERFRRDIWRALPDEYDHHTEPERCIDAILTSWRRLDAPARIPPSEQWPTHEDIYG